MLSRIIRGTFSTSGRLFTWGETTFGWGRPTNNQYWTPGAVPNFNDVVSVSTGPYHLGFVTQDHSVYTVGLDDDGQLGQASESLNELPRRVSFDSPNTKIQSLSLGTRHSLALSSDGGVYAWGNPAAVGPFSSSTSARVPVRIPDSAFNNHKIVSVSAANDFSIAVCDQGDLYAWGIGLTSLPFWTQISNTPVIVEQVSELLHNRHATIKKAVAIDSFIIILLSNGRIYCRGVNNGGVFGARSNHLVVSDLKLRSFTKTYDELYKGQKIVDFEASSNSLIFRTESDKIFYTGMNVVFQPTPFPLDQGVKKMFATKSSVGVIGEDGKFYFLNEKLVDQSDFVCKKNRLFVNEDVNLESLINVGGTHHLRYALVK